VCARARDIRLAVDYIQSVAMGGQSRGAPTAKRAAVQAAVLQATDALLGEGVSYADLNIERIATRAGISRTAFYFYFRDKRELLLRLTEDVVDELYRQGDIWFSGTGEPAAELREALANIAGVYRENGAVLRAIVQAAATDHEVAVFWHALVDRFVHATSARIEDLQHDGRTAVREDARAAAFVLCWMIERAFHQQLVLGQPVPEQALVDALTGVFVRAVYGTG
jgi:AcrR family transcriptional regulator